MLPPDFRWDGISAADYSHPNQLLLDAVEIARPYQRLDDHTWWISLNNSETVIGGSTSSAGMGMAASPQKSGRRANRPVRSID